jgi:hypothetical protein
MLNVRRTLFFSVGAILAGGALSTWDIFVHPFHHYTFNDQPNIFLALFAVLIVCGVGAACFLLASFGVQKLFRTDGNAPRSLVALGFGFIYMSAVVLWPPKDGQPSSRVWVWVVLAPLLFGVLSSWRLGHVDS